MRKSSAKTVNILYISVTNIFNSQKCAPDVSQVSHCELFHVGWPHVHVKEWETELCHSAMHFDELFSCACSTWGLGPARFGWKEHVDGRYVYKLCT